MLGLIILKFYSMFCPYSAATFDIYCIHLLLFSFQRHIIILPLMLELLLLLLRYRVLCYPSLQPIVMTDHYHYHRYYYYLFLIWQKIVKTKDIEAVEGKSVSLPCPLSAPLDDVYMVLWFRDNAGIPLYR